MLLLHRLSCTANVRGPRAYSVNADLNRERQGPHRIDRQRQRSKFLRTTPGQNETAALLLTGISERNRFVVKSYTRLPGD